MERQAYLEAALDEALRVMGECARGLAHMKKDLEGMPGMEVPAMLTKSLHDHLHKTVCKIMEDTQPLPPTPRRKASGQRGGQS